MELQCPGKEDRRSVSWCHCDLVLICRSFSRLDLEIGVVMLITGLPEHRACEPEGLALLLPEAQPVFPGLVPLPNPLPRSSFCTHRCHPGSEALFQSVGRDSAPPPLRVCFCHGHLRPAKTHFRSFWDPLLAGFVPWKGNALLCADAAPPLLLPTGGGSTWLSPLIPQLVTKAREPWPRKGAYSAASKGKGGPKLSFCLRLCRKVLGRDRKEIPETGVFPVS